MEGLLDAVADLLRQALLDLQAAGVGLHHAGDLGEPGDAAVRDVGDMGLADEREHVVLAQREQLDVLDQDHLAVRLREYGGTDDGLAVRNCQAFATRSGVLTSPSRSGSSPSSLRMAFTCPASSCVVFSSYSSIFRYAMVLILLRPATEILDCKINEKNSFYRFFVYLCSPKYAEGPERASEKTDK